MTYPSRPIASNAVPESIRTALLDFYRELPRGPKAPRFSLVRALREMHTPNGLRDGYERELLGSFAVALGRHYDPHRVTIPWAVLSPFRDLAATPVDDAAGHSAWQDPRQRDLTAASGPSAGYLIGEEQARVVDVLRGWSIVVDGGIQVIPMDHGNLAVPRNMGNTTPTWLATENTNATEVGPAVGDLTLSPKTCAIYTEFSHVLSKVAPQLEYFLRQHLVGSAGQAIDTAVFGGAGASGQPLGILNTAGVGVVSGASINWAGVRTIRKSAIAAGAREENMIFVGGSTAQDVLAGRERISGGGHAIWDDSGNMAGLRAVATNRIPLDAVVCGDFSQVVMALWGGVEVEINPFANFQAGIQGARVMVAMDAAVLNPGAFSVATGIT